jgi:CHAT domain-containing protein
LPGTRREADALKTDFPDARLQTEDKAQEAIAKSEAGNYRYLHFATHGLFNDAVPMLSSVVLAQPPKDSAEDGFLTAREIFNLDLKADLVVLSACDTARGEKKSGEGVVGLTWALFVAGAPSQVVSQWAVNDAGTAKLMQAFYANLKAKQPKGAALRAAELSLLKDGEHGHPYYWAPFILFGEWN